MYLPIEHTEEEREKAETKRTPLDEIDKTSLDHINCERHVRHWYILCVV